ncbi:unnamed protein product, partial [Cyprideis torosa]
MNFQDSSAQVITYWEVGKAVAIEMWAMPEEDKNVQQIFEEYTDDLNKPLSLADFAKTSMQNEDKYIGIFIPGGHGAMLGLPENENLRELLIWAKEKDHFILSICHGPAAFLSAAIG